MRILYHHRTRAEDAQGIHIREMAKAFRELGHEVQVVALVHDSKKEEGKKACGLWGGGASSTPNWLYELMTLAYNFYGYRRLCQAIGSFRPDFIYERYSLNTFCGIWASSRFGIPLVLEVNAPLYYEQNQLGKLTFKRLARFSEQWICSSSARTVVVSNVMKKLLLNEGVPDEKMLVMPNGVDPQRFNPNVSGQEIRQRYDLTAKFVVGFVGWFRKWHGLETLLEAMYERKLEQQGFAMLLVGDGPALAELRSYAEKHELLQSVVFTGSVHREDIPRHIAAMDVAIQPSAPQYACPIKIIEYMAMAKCIIAPNQPNICELLEHRVTGFLFRDRHDMMSLLLSLKNDPHNMTATGQRAAEAIKTRGLLWRANAQKTISLLSRGNQDGRSDTQS